MTKQKECAPTVESQGANGIQPPRIIARICKNWGITPRTLLADVAIAPLVIAGLYIVLLGMCAFSEAMRP